MSDISWVFCCCCCLRNKCIRTGKRKKENQQQNTAGRWKSNRGRDGEKTGRGQQWKQLITPRKGEDLGWPACLHGKSRQLRQTSTFKHVKEAGQLPGPHPTLRQEQLYLQIGEDWSNWDNYVQPSPHPATGCKQPGLLSSKGQRDSCHYSSEGQTYRTEEMVQHTVSWHSPLAPGPSLEYEHTI